MVDVGPFGRAWRSLVNGVCCFDTFERFVGLEGNDLRGALEALSRETPPAEDSKWTATFLLLQSASFRSVPVIQDPTTGAWRLTSSPRVVMNYSRPCTPTAAVLRTRVASFMRKLRGVTVIHDDVVNALLSVSLPPSSVLYIDPPYCGTSAYTSYSSSPDVTLVARARACVPTSNVLVSERVPFSTAAYTREIGVRHNTGYALGAKPWNAANVKSEFISHFPPL
jgi:hypothetical protein